MRTLRVPSEHHRVPSAQCRFEYPNACPAVPCARWVAAVHAHRNAHWQVGHGLLGLPKPERDGETAKPGERAKRLSLGSARLEQTATAAMGASGAHRNRAERRGRTAGARYGMGVQRKGRMRATTARAWRQAQWHGDKHSAARRSWQRSTRRCAGHGMATANEAASTSLVVHLTAVVTVHEGASRATSTLNRRVSASLSHLALHCGCGWLVSHAHQRRRAAGECTSVAMAFASACG